MIVGALGVIVNRIFCVCVGAPDDVPVTVTVYVPGASEFVFSKVIVLDVVVVVSCVGVAVAVPEGDTDVVKSIGLVCPPK